MIEIKGLQKVVDQSLVLDIEALTVEAGEVAALVGPVGSGKARALAVGFAGFVLDPGQVKFLGIRDLHISTFHSKLLVDDGAACAALREQPARLLLLFYEHHWQVLL